MKALHHLNHCFCDTAAPVFGKDWGREHRLTLTAVGSVLCGLQQLSGAMPHKLTHFHVTGTTVQSCVSNPRLPSIGH